MSLIVTGWQSLVAGPRIRVKDPCETAHGQVAFLHPQVAPELLGHGLTAQGRVNTERERETKTQSEH